MALRGVVAVAALAAAGAGAVGVQVASGAPMAGLDAASSIAGRETPPSAGAPMAGWEPGDPMSGWEPGAPMSGWDGVGGVQEAGEARAGGRVLGVAVSADARETGAALVFMNHRLEVQPETDAIPFTLLLFAPTDVEEISARVDGETLAVRVADDGGPRLEGEVELPAALASSGRVTLDLDYRVAEAVRADGGGVRVVLPMLAVDWAPAEARPRMFQAEVTLPEGMAAREVFPVTPAGGSAPGVARTSLQVVPAVVRVRARPEGSLGFSLPGVLELLVLVAVIACGMAGLRYVRRVR